MQVHGPIDHSVHCLLAPLWWVMPKRNRSAALSELRTFLTALSTEIERFTFCYVLAIDLH